MHGLNISASCGLAVAHGVDLVDLSDFSRLLTEPASIFLDRHFTDQERRTAGVGVNQASRLAGRFAVKEAVMKALGTGWGEGISFTDVEVINLETGAPTIVLHRKLATIQEEAGISNWLVSTSHTASIAMASVIGLAASGHQ